MERKQNILKGDLEKLAPLKDLEVVINDLKIEYDALLKGLENVTAGFQLFEIYRKAHQETAKLAFKHEIFANVNPPPQLEEITLLETTIIDMRNLERKEAKLESDLQTLMLLKAPSELENIDVLEAAIGSLKQFGGAEKEKRSALVVITELASPPEMQDGSLLEEHVKILRQFEKAKQSAEEKVQKAGDTLKKWVKENPTCPTCGGPLNEEHLLDHE